MSAELFGPWRIEGNFDADTGVSIIDRHDFEICEIGPFDGDWETDDIGRARVIAAAPEVLSSVNRLMDELQAAKDRNPEAFAEFVNEVCGPGFPDACIAVAQAVGKAEGRA
jgi:hypothetical protein